MGDYIKMRLLGWVLIQSDRCLYKKRKLGHTDVRGTRAQKDTPVKRSKRGAEERSPGGTTLPALVLALPASRTLRNSVPVV